MPIGFDRGDLGGGGGADETGRRVTGEAVTRRHAEEVRGGAEEAGAVERGVWAWVEIVRRTLIPEVWTRWATVEDERVCPECGPLDGLVWPVDAGPTPPLHVNCRCRRVYAFTQWRVRALSDWALRWIGG